MIRSEAKVHETLLEISMVNKDLFGKTGVPIITVFNKEILQKMLEREDGKPKRVVSEIINKLEDLKNQLAINIMELQSVESINGREEAWQ